MYPALTRYIVHCIAVCAICRGTSGIAFSQLECRPCLRKSLSFFFVAAHFAFRIVAVRTRQVPQGHFVLCVFCCVLVVMARVGVHVVCLSSVAAALVTSPIVVEYDNSQFSRVWPSADVAFESRLARVVRDIDRADVQLSGLDPDLLASSFAHANTEQVLPRKLGVIFPNATLANIRVAADVATSRALVAHGFRKNDADHIRDYNLPCPSGWVDRGDGDACDAPVSYDGPCGGTLHFGGLAAHEKMDLANSCGVVFDRVGDCTADFSTPCPVGWRLVGAGECSAPASYAGPCVRRKVFNSMVAADKAWFQDVCDVKWPCRASWVSFLRPSTPDECKEDFTKPCPHNWEERTDVCLAPAAYDGPCSVALAAATFTAEEKHAVSQNCGAPWPCSA